RTLGDFPDGADVEHRNLRQLGNLLQDALLRPPDAVFRRVAERQVKNEWEERIVGAHGERFARQRGDHLYGYAEKVTRGDMNAVAQRDGRLRAALGQIESNLCAGIAHADDQDGLAGKRRGVEVVRAVDEPTGKPLCPGNDWTDRFAVESGCNHDMRSLDER